MLSDSSYFDHNATTPIAPEVLDAHIEALRGVFGNASSIHHYGQAARQALEESRQRVSALVNASPKELVFLSGGTEANNTVLFGVARGHVVTTSIEHPAVLNPCARLEQQGTAVTYVPVDSRGVVDPDDIRRALRPDTALISVMHVNNEIGTVQPVAEIARMARESGIPMHCDGVQAVGRIPVSLHELDVDYYTMSGHKMYAPKGVGMLYVSAQARMTPLLYGGRHERGLRPGTENVPAAVAFGVAASSMNDNLASEMTRLAALRDRLENGILEHIDQVKVNGAGALRAPNTTNICFAGIEGEAIVIALDLKGFCVSSGSACSSGAVEPSHVLTAIGRTRTEAKSSVRLSLGRSNTVEQVDALIDAVVSVTARLRSISTDYVAHHA